VLTVGHSTRPIEEFIELLVAHGVTQLIDVRTVPRSRHNPQFNAETLPGQLTAANIGYAHAASLGGFRRTTPASPNTGWRNLSFRCAEAVPWRCHRSLIADALVVHGVMTCEILSPNWLQPHKLTPFARVSGTDISYPPELFRPTA
jgi:uncharacterized protein (DUF488 family)